jgi:hypothetical protein
MYNIWQQLYTAGWNGAQLRDLLRKIAADALIENYKIETNRGLTDDIVRDLPY